MRVAARLGLAAIALCFCAGAVAAASGWQNINLDNNPAFTIDIPALIGKNYLPDDNQRAQGLVMSFSYSTKDSGGIGCGVNQIGYEFFAPRDEVVTGMTLTPEYFCKLLPNATGEKPLSSNGAVSNASPAAICATSFTLGAGANGYVFSALSVAAPDKLYHLNCIANAANQDTVEKLWGTTWAKFVAHVQQSIHLPVQGQLRN